MEDDELIDLDLENSDHFLQKALKVYLAGPLTHIDGDVERLCIGLRKAAEEELNRNRDLFFKAYDPANHTQPGSDHTPEEVYLKDFIETVTSDLILFHAAAPSLGMGMEAQLAADATIPRIITHQKGLTISRMFSGAYSPTLAIIEYENVDDFRKQLHDVLPQISMKILKTASQRHALFEDAKNAGIGTFLFKRRILLGKQRSHLAGDVDILEYFLHAIECDDKLSILLNQLQVKRIADHLNCDAIYADSLLTIKPKIDKDIILKQFEKESLDKLLIFARETTNVSDKKIIQCWSKYQRELKTASKGREPLDTPFSVNDWHRTYHSLDKLF